MKQNFTKKMCTKEELIQKTIDLDILLFGLVCILRGSASSNCIRQI